MLTKLLGLRRAFSTMPRIVTHSGAFHCDESLACYLLLQTEQFKDSEIVRSRDPEIIKTGDIVVDVGAEYDPSRSTSIQFFQNFY